LSEFYNLAKNTSHRSSTPLTTITLTIVIPAKQRASRDRGAAGSGGKSPRPIDWPRFPGPGSSLRSVREDEIEVGDCPEGGLSRRL